MLVSAANPSSFIVASTHKHCNGQTNTQVNYANNALLSQQLQILPKQQADALAGFIGLDRGAIWWDVGILWVMNVALQIMTYVSLSVRAGTSRAVV